MPAEPNIDIALLTRTNVRMLKASLPRVLPTVDDGRFDKLLKALDGMPLRVSRG